MDNQVGWVHKNKYNYQFALNCTWNKCNWHTELIYSNTIVLMSNYFEENYFSFLKCVSELYAVTNDILVYSCITAASVMSNSQIVPVLRRRYLHRSSNPTEYCNCLQ